MYLPYEIAEITSESAAYKVNRKILKILISSMLAGLFIGLGYYANIVIRANQGLDSGLNIFLGGLIFSTGIVMVLIAGADLFTGSCLIMFGVFEKKVKFSKVLVHLLIVLLGNFLGGLFLALIVYFSKMPNDAVIEYISKVTISKASLTFWEALLRGILCNILVAIGVYMSYASKSISGKILASIIPVTAFVIMGFEHVVANMFVLPLGLMYVDLQTVSIIDLIIKMIFNNIIPVTIGNFIGGGIILPFAYHYIYLKK